MDYISQINVNDTNYSVGLPNIYINSKGNFNIETSAEIGNTTKGKINIESMDDIQFKPGDDIILYSHHRPQENQDEVTVKVTDGDDIPVKLQVNASEMLLTTKDKTGSNAKVFDVTVNSAKNTRGYLKVRAQAIDLRSETHGGIAIQPKGRDGDGNMNKIKFEHGGGDGLEFGTFNTERTSIFTDEYRFNKDGLWYMASRIKEVSDKRDTSDDTTSYKYVKQADDFYDVINPDDEVANTNSIIKTANAFNYGKNRHAKYKETFNDDGSVKKKTLEIETVTSYSYDRLESFPSGVTPVELTLPSPINNPFGIFTESDYKDAVKTIDKGNGTFAKFGTDISAGDYIMVNGTPCQLVEHFAPNIEITSTQALSLKAKNAPLELNGEGIEFSSDAIDFGEMEDGAYFLYKLTKKNNSKPCDLLKVKVINNQASALEFTPDAGGFNVESFCNENITVPGKVAEPTTDAEANQHIVTVAQCKVFDVIKLVNYMKANHLGPWQASV